MLKGWLILLAMTAVALSACMAIIVLAGIPTGETRWPEALIVLLLATVGIALGIRSRKK